ncbi:DUF1593 domain-containing protein [Cyclobacterium jeungdonense]|uniref:DUF1593 domain-containing protein n=1 Tax=Cyclobacterium jeungdonense TaxID=708087 RepID=A0ABT8CGN4_9BACT|nr:DUF1593 domain-containing protein [Cyclobacterium jeungdonense]MDN3690703.1 DUF1593 domain-containing protein [Cyclobacterium jeungdonense]
MKVIVYLFFGLLINCLLLGNGISRQKPQVILLTDIGGDTDDEQSLTRFLYYADHFDIKALCATSRLGHGQDIRPELIKGHLQAYREVYPNLILHSKDFPHPDVLVSLVREGQGNSKDIGESFDTEASEAIIKVVDEAQALVHIPVWGGLRELAQALWKVKQNRAPEEVKSFCRKIQVHAIGDQDGHREYLLEEFKELNFIANGYAWYGFTGVRELSAFRGMYMTGDQHMQDGDWIRANIHGNGPLSDRYQLHGHGTNGMKEGDSPSFLGLIGNGLNIPDRPDWGGWGGRYRLLSSNLYIDAPDFFGGTLNERHSVARWRTAFQSDFMARVQWAHLPYEDANHNPKVVLNDHEGVMPLVISAKPGEQVRLDAGKSSDPDGQQLDFNWWIYEEIYRPTQPIRFHYGENNSAITFEMPVVAAGESVHLILEVRDRGLPSMIGYKRILLNPAP